MVTTIDDHICPLCNKANICQVSEQIPCWCMQSKVPQALIEKVPEQQRGKSCICRQCIQAYQISLNRLNKS